MTFATCEQCTIVRMALKVRRTKMAFTLVLIRTSRTARTASMLFYSSCKMRKRVTNVIRSHRTSSTSLTLPRDHLRSSERSTPVYQPLKVNLQEAEVVYWSCASALKSTSRPRNGTKRDATRLHSLVQRNRHRAHDFDVHQQESVYQSLR